MKCEKWLKRKLVDHFGNEIIITDYKRLPVKTFRENAYSILNDGWKNNKVNEDEENFPSLIWLLQSYVIALEQSTAN